MSIKYMSQVWEYEELKGSDLLVLLALADHANDDGICWPSIPRIASRARISERQTQRVVQRLQRDGYIQILKKGDGRGNSTLYQLILKGELLSPIREGEKGDTKSPIRRKRVTSVTERVTSVTEKGDIAMSPESSKKHQEAEDPPPPPLSNDLSKITKHYENNIGVINYTIGEEIKGVIDDYPSDWIMDAIDEAVIYNKRSWAYVRKVLRSWDREGRKPPDADGRSNGVVSQIIKGEDDEEW